MKNRLKTIQEHEFPAYVKDKQLNRTDKEFAKELGVHPNTIWNLRHGVTQSHPRKLVKALGLRIAYQEEA